MTLEEISEKSLALHKELAGKIRVECATTVETAEDLALIYTPGVAAACKAIEAEPELSFSLTRRGNLVAVITDGSAVLGLGDIGPSAGMPVMEGKCALFKTFGDVDAIPLCLDTHDVDTFVEAVCLMSKSFGGINLEDIAAPRCFEIERKLKERLDIPVFHDDQHGTAIVCAAALINACKVTKKTWGELNIVINGAGAAGLAICDLLHAMGAGNIVVCDSKGTIVEGDERLNAEKTRIASYTNPKHIAGTLADALVDSDVFIGVSKAGVLSKEMVSSMHEPIVFAMANPVPEILPDEAKEAGAKVVGTGRSDFENQINNVLVFPGIFKGALAARARDISEEMKIAAAYGLASMVSEDELSPEFVIPSALDKEAAEAVSAAVIKAVR